MSLRALNSTPRSDGFYMPAEWVAHKQTWMVWPVRNDNWRNDARDAQAAFVAVAHAIAQFEPVSMCASAKEYQNAVTQLSAKDSPHPIRVVEISSDDAWCRDTGPTFVIDGRGGIRGCDWTFNAWGGHSGGLYAPWQRDDELARKVLSIEGLERYRTEGFVLEGGAFHVDGEGTLLTTETCLLNPNRNPHLDRGQIEATLAQYLGIDQVIWLPRGIVNDETDDHVDNMACFCAPGEVLLAWTDDRTDPQYERCEEALAVLESAKDARGRRLIVHKLPLPRVLYATEDERAGVRSGSGVERKADDRLAASYINFVVCNGGIVVPTFDDENDAVAARVLAERFPTRRVVQVPGREILLGGGNFHCITQQQPAT